MYVRKYFRDVRLKWAVFGLFFTAGLRSGIDANYEATQIWSGGDANSLSHTSKSHTTSQRVLDLFFEAVWIWILLGLKNYVLKYCRDVSCKWAVLEVFFGGICLSWLEIVCVCVCVWWELRLRWSEEQRFRKIIKSFFFQNCVCLSWDSNPRQKDCASRLCVRLRPLNHRGTPEIKSIWTLLCEVDSCQSKVKSQKLGSAQKPSLFCFSLMYPYQSLVLLAVLGLKGFSFPIVWAR